MTKQESQILHFFLGFIFFAVLLIQLVAIPGSAASYAETYPEFAYLESLYVTALVIAFVGLEVALLAAWHLVTIAVVNRIWADRQAKWANIMVGSLLVMAAILTGIFVHAGSVAGVGGPPMLFGIIGCCAVVLITVVSRRWIREWFQNDTRILEFL